MFIIGYNAGFFDFYISHSHNFEYIFTQFHNFESAVRCAYRKIWPCAESASWCFDLCRNFYYWTYSSLFRLPFRIWFHKKIMTCTENGHISDLAFYDMICRIDYFYWLGHRTNCFDFLIQRNNNYTNCDSVEIRNFSRITILSEQNVCCLLLHR